MPTKPVRKGLSKPALEHTELMLLGKGELFGEVSVMGQSQNYAVVASTNVNLLLLPARSLAALLSPSHYAGVLAMATAKQALYSQRIAQGKLVRKIKNPLPPTPPPFPLPSPKIPPPPTSTMRKEKHKAYFLAESCYCF